MSGLLERASAHFVVPSGERPTPRRTVAPAPQTPMATVVGAWGDAGPVARLLGSELRLRTGADCVLLVEWRGREVAPERGGTASPKARRLAERLVGRGIEAVARGRTVHLALPADPSEALALLRRALVAAAAPTVCALSGPRPASFDALLDEQDLVVAPPADASEAFTELAVAGLASVRAPVVVGRPVPRGTGRLLAASSVATSRWLGEAVTGAVRGLA